MNFQLFRGDNYLNQETKPGLYRGNGLTSKAFYGNNDPAYIDKKGLLETIRMHVKPIGKQDEAIYNVTGFLSFTKEFDRALEWASGLKAGLIAVADDYTETRYVFTATFHEPELLEIGDGIYEFKYSCNRTLKKADNPDFLTTYALQHNICELCRNQEKAHSLILIDTVRFLARYKNLGKYEAAYSNASRDSEWLLLPNDLLGQQFKSARIQRADFWSAKHYRLSNEMPRDSMYFIKFGIL